MTRTTIAFDFHVALVGAREIWRCIRNRTCLSWRSAANHPMSSSSGRQGGFEKPRAVLIA